MHGHKPLPSHEGTPAERPSNADSHPHTGAAAAGFIDKSNKIFIELINPTGAGYYVGGDVVMGKIHLTCNVPFFCNGVILRVKGEEKVKFQEVVTEREGEGEDAKEVSRTVEHKSSKVFFDQKLVPYPQGGVIPQGVYEYPFEYPLPANLPGVFRERGGDFDKGTGYKASIKYTLLATVDVTFLNDLKHKVCLVVNEKFDKLVQPTSGSAEKGFLFGGGRLSIVSTLDKNAYFPGDRVLCRLEANSTSTKPTRRVRCDVERTVVLRADGHEKRVDAHVFRSERPGFDPCFYGAVFLPFYIPVDLPPATTGANVESRYTFHVICDIPGAIDLETPLAVRLLAPQFLYSAVPPTPAHVPPPPDVSFRPPWQHDKTTSACHACGTHFTLFKRRHHCRHCGMIFCGACTKHRTAIANLGYAVPVRVCDACLQEAQAGGKRYQTGEQPAQ